MAKLSYIDKYNIKELKDIESELGKIYAGAYKDAKTEIDRYWYGYDEVVNGKTVHHSGFYERYSEELQAYKDGTYTDDQWNSWVNSQMAREQHLQDMADVMARRVSETNQIAADYVNGRTPAIYAENANYEAFELEKGSSGRVNFTLVNENSLQRLATGANQVEFKAKWKELNPNMQRDYNWNKQKITNALQQGMLRGESTTKISNRFLQVQGSNKAAAVRNARTAVTSAQNSGKLDTYDKAADMGLTVMKEWIATSDDRTRDSHAELDGVVVPYDEEFPNGLMYPGDPKGAPEEVYNCRCTMRRVRKAGDSRTGNDAASYAKWKDSKADEEDEDEED